ncbi:MAG: hypothetical protein ABIE03_01725 [Patescibacteria group bacterium]|nr:hypothetical protein [Patescibacteria group bacterium]
MSIRIKRFYDKIPNYDKSKIDNDFDNIDDLLIRLEGSIDNKDIKIVHQPIEDAFKSRLTIILYQNNLRAFYLLTGIVTELNADNLPAALPLIRAFYELMIQLGYLCSQILNHNDLNYLLSELFHKVFLGNRNEGAGVLALGKVETISIMTMLSHAEKVFNSIDPEGTKDKQILTNYYADLSNKCHPNFNSNMFFTSLDEKGELLGLDDIGENMSSVKALVYHEYMSPLLSAIDHYKLYMDKINADPKVVTT